MASVFLLNANEIVPVYAVSYPSHRCEPQFEHRLSLLYPSTVDTGFSYMSQLHNICSLHSAAN
jgi:hypothetical protein